MGTLQGRVAIVTGGGAGIGLAIAQELATAGCDIAVAERDTAAGEAAAETLAALGVRARAYAVDVSVAEQVDAAFAAVPRDLGRLDIVVNNAGVSHVGPSLLETSDEAWAESVAVMQTGVFYCMRAAARHLLPQGSGTASSARRCGMPTSSAARSTSPSTCARCRWAASAIPARSASSPSTCAPTTPPTSRAGASRSTAA